MKNDKSLSNDGLTKEYYETFWEEIKTPFPYSMRKSFFNRRAKYFAETSGYKTNWKKDKDQRLIKNWHPISLLNVESKSLANRLHDVIPKVLT